VLFRSSKNAIHIYGKTIATEIDREGPVTLGVRPEDFLLESSDAPNTVNATITLIEPMGADTLLFCVSGDNQEITVRVPRHVRVAEGDKLNLKPRDDAVHVFDAESEQRLN